MDSNATKWHVESIMGQAWPAAILTPRSGAEIRSKKTNSIAERCVESVMGQT